MQYFRTKYFYLMLALLAVTTSIAGCAESRFDLAPGSRLPKWFTIPEGTRRSELRVTMDYYIGFNGREAVLKLYKNDEFFSINKVIGDQRGFSPIELKNPPAGFPKGYPAYEVITVNGVTDIIEHRRMEPVFYVTDDPEIWEELGVEKK